MIRAESSHVVKIELVMTTLQKAKFVQITWHMLKSMQCSNLITRSMRMSKHILCILHLNLVFNVLGHFIYLESEI